MGFLDKAKKLAEQAQTKLDEVQKQVNTSGESTSQGPPIEDVPLVVELRDGDPYLNYLRRW